MNTTTVVGYLEDNYIAEEKYFPLGQPIGINAPIFLTLTPLIFSLSDLPTGVTNTSKIGNEIMITSLNFNYRLEYDLFAVATNPQQCSVRCVIFQWKKDTIPLYDEIFNNTPNGTAENIFSSVNWNYNVNKRIFREIYYDEVIELFTSRYYNTTTPAISVTNTAHSMKNFRIKIDFMRLPIKMRKIQYYNTTTQGYNKIYVCFLSTSSQGPYLFYQSQLKYIDV